MNQVNESEAAACAAETAYSVTLPRTEASVARARRLVSASLRAWALEAGAEGACLVVSELVTNAVRHARLEVVHVKVSRVGRGACGWRSSTGPGPCRRSSRRAGTTSRGGAGRGGRVLCRVGSRADAVG